MNERRREKGKERREGKWERKMREKEKGGEGEGKEGRKCFISQCTQHILFSYMASNIW